MLQGCSRWKLQGYGPGALDARKGAATIGHAKVQQHWGERMASVTTIYSLKSPAGAQLCLSFHSPPKRLNRHIIHRRTVSIILFTRRNVPIVFRPNYSRIVLRTVVQYDRSFPYNVRERSVLPAFSKNETLTLHCHILYMQVELK